jgi:hypothetical protein
MPENRPAPAVDVDLKRLTCPGSQPTIFPMAMEHSPMAAADWGMKLKAFLTTVMSLLSILVTGLGGIEKDVLWLWVGFICCLVSGVFIQLFINRVKNDVASGRR